MWKALYSSLAPMRSTADIISSVLECIRPDGLRSSAQFWAWQHLGIDFVWNSMVCRMAGGKVGPAGAGCSCGRLGGRRSWPSSDRLLQVDAWAQLRQPEVEKKMHRPPWGGCELGQQEAAGARCRGRARAGGQREGRWR
jgi:hypothetical protein